jgi:anthranilate phosphoribosyltransferase
MAASPTPPLWFAPTLSSLLDRTDLEAVRMCELMEGLLGGACGEAETAALLVALRMKGETADELAAAAAVLRDHMKAVDVGGMDVLDTCGTGGDGTNTFNISTATALVVAAAGVPVVKHGNRAMSSRSGSADVLAVLGVNVEAPALATRACLEQTGMIFCLATAFHPAMRAVAALRRRLGVRTLFNCLGPLANPAGAAFQLIGVGRAEWLDRMAGALARLGTRHALLVCGHDGLDEVSLSAPTLVREVRNGQVTAGEWTPADFGLAPCRLEELFAGSPEASAVLVRQAIEGREGPAYRVTLANAAAALLAAGKVTTAPEGVARAAETIAAGGPARVLAALVQASR